MARDLTKDELDNLRKLAQKAGVARAEAARAATDYAIALAHAKEDCDQSPMAQYDFEDGTWSTPQRAARRAPAPAPAAPVAAVPAEETKPQ